MKAEHIMFRGIFYTRYPDSKSLSGRNYFYPAKSHRDKGFGALHQEIYKAYYGFIPKGCVIHHKDGNTLNNDIDNLECLTPGEHTLEHAGPTPARQEAAARARELTKEWHASEEGKEWHKQHGHDVYNNRKPTSKMCDECGCTFESVWNRETDKWCSKKCRDKHHWRNKIGWHETICEVCCRVFLEPQRGKRRTCDRSCGATLQHREGKGRYRYL